jgi:hypothetical protein
LFLPLLLPPFLGPELHGFLRHERRRWRRQPIRPTSPWHPHGRGRQHDRSKGSLGRLLLQEYPPV